MDRWRAGLGFALVPSFWGDSCGWRSKLAEAPPTPAPLSRPPLGQFRFVLGVPPEGRTKTNWRGGCWTPDQMLGPGGLNWTGPPGGPSPTVAPAASLMYSKPVGQSPSRIKKEGEDDSEVDPCHHLMTGVTQRGTETTRLVKKRLRARSSERLLMGWSQSPNRPGY